ncbi:pectin methylesterase [Paenibacillus alba]|uniref:pectinesterase family protein n=1 Tax=Paenibacillus alba TaxID=1197127 RepID=UPI00156567FB|nr:pectinesterase family protein [Paenibacillus alba]NQX66973.1 pectin methylesterase [Paenibacillus alba]
MIVAADGTGDFTRIQDAIDRIPANNQEEAIIYIKKGIYREKLNIEIPNISLFGESAQETIITFDDYAKKTYGNGELYHTFNSYTVFIGANRFTADNLTFENSAGKGEVVGQAVAAYVDGDRVVFRNCRFLGNQDTLFTGPLPEVPLDRSTFGGPREGAPRLYGRHYYDRCYIEGDIDFIFGSATAVFNDCEIFSKKRDSHADTHGWITAASTPEGAKYGYVFLNCKLIGDAPPQSVYLGRPWRIYAKTAFIHCWMGAHIQAEGWNNWNKPESEQTSFYCEYNNSGPGYAKDKRVSWAAILTDEQAANFTVSSVLAGQDGWNPVGK